MPEDQMKLQHHIKVNFRESLGISIEPSVVLIEPSVVLLNFEWFQWNLQWFQVPRLEK